MPPQPPTPPHVPQGEDLKNLWDWNLTNHKPTPEAIRKMEGLRSAAKAMKNAIIDMVPSGREQSMALTSCEQMVFYAMAGIARRENEDITPPDDTPEEDKVKAASRN